jgi:hypothetical protein
LFGPFGPGEGAAIGVVAGDELLKEFLEILFGSLHAVRQSLLAQDAEEAFDQIQPGSMGRSVVELDSWVAPEPAAGGLILVDVQIIRNDMEFSIGIARTTSFMKRRKFTEVRRWRIVSRKRAWDQLELSVVPQTGE